MPTVLDDTLPQTFGLPVRRALRRIGVAVEWDGGLRCLACGARWKPRASGTGPTTKLVTGGIAYARIPQPQGLSRAWWCCPSGTHPVPPDHPVEDVYQT
jgi:hypothetical protein